MHTCYTGIGGYFIKGFGGIRTAKDQVGYQHFELKPAPVGDLTFANTKFESMYGSIVSNWKRAGNTLTFHVEIPVNTTAKVYLPATSADVVSESGVQADKSRGVTYIGTEASKAFGNYVVYELASGHYD
ncbi:MAG: alpha-L-rhamnosidase C-terminal domain-containing protein, partial [Bacteroidota bacterium]